MKISICLYLGLMLLFMVAFGYVGYYASVYFQFSNPELEFSCASGVGLFVYLAICMYKDVRL